MADYCTIQDVKAAMNITTTSDDVRLQLAVTAASRQIEMVCGRYFYQDSVATSRIFVGWDIYTVETDDFDNDQTIILQTDTGGDRSWATTWTPADYQCEPINNVVMGQYWPNDKIRAIRGLYFPIYGAASIALAHTQALVKVTAQWGWATVPDPIAQAAVIQAEALFKSAEVPLGATAFGEMGVLRLRQTLHPTAAMLIEPYAKDEVFVL